MGIHPTRDIFTKRYPLRKDIHSKRISTSHEYSFRKDIPPKGHPRHKDIHSTSTSPRKGIHAERIFIPQGHPPERASTPQGYSFRKDIPPKGHPRHKDIHSARTSPRKGIHATRVPGLLFSPLSERPERSVKKGRLFERSEFLPFSEGKGTSRRKKSALNFSLVLSFVSRQKKRTSPQDKRKNIVILQT